MNLQRSLSAAITMLAVVAIGPALAQSGADSLKNHVADTITRDTPHWHFDGKVSTVNPGAHQITIAADSIPLQYGGKTTLPYDVPASVSMEKFPEGAVVNGDLVVRSNRTLVEDVKLGPTPKHTAKKSTVKKSTARKTPVKQKPS